VGKVTVGKSGNAYV